MARYIKNALMLAKVEATAGTDAAPTGTADAVLLVGDAEFSPIESSTVERNLSMPWFGASMGLLGSVYSKITFSCEAAGSGTAGTAPEWAEILLGCATSNSTLATPARVEILPASTSLKTLTLYFYDDGLLHKATGVVGNAKLSAKLGEVAKWSFDMLGAYVAPVAVANVAATLTAWKTPPVLMRSNVVDITLGCTYSAGALSGGTVMGSTGLELDFGNKSAFFSTLSREGGELSARESKVSFELELSAAQEVAAITDILASTTTSLGFTIGTATGNKQILFLPSIQRTSYKKGNKDGVRTVSFEARCLPVSGNDEWRIACL